MSASPVFADRRVISVGTYSSSSDDETAIRQLREFSSVAVRPRSGGVVIRAGGGSSWEALTPDLRV